MKLNSFLFWQKQCCGRYHTIIRMTNFRKAFIVKNNQTSKRKLILRQCLTKDNNSSNKFGKPTKLHLFKIWDRFLSLNVLLSSSTVRLCLYVWYSKRRMRTSKWKWFCYFRILQFLRRSPRFPEMVIGLTKRLR